MDLNLADDFDTFDGLVPVTFFRRTAEDTFDAGTAVPLALKRATTKSVLSVGGMLHETDVIWHIPASALESGAPPKVSDVVREEDGTRWSVTRVEHQTLTVRWRLTCEREVS